MNMQISKRDAKILIILAGIVILALAWFFPYSSTTAANQELESQNAELTTKKVYLQGLAAKEKQYKSEITAMSESIDKEIKEFPADVREEDAVMFAYHLDKKAFHITEAALTPANLLYISGQGAQATVTEDGSVATADTGTSAAASTPASTSTDASSDAAAASGTTTDTSSDTAATSDTSADADPLSMYGVNCTLSFSCTYKGFKKAINQIQTSKIKKNVDTISLVLDVETGYLTGTISSNMFYVTGTDKTYKEPKIPEQASGVSDLFGARKK